MSDLAVYGESSRSFEIQATKTAVCSYRCGVAPSVSSLSREMKLVGPVMPVAMTS